MQKGIKEHTTEKKCTDAGCEWVSSGRYDSKKTFSREAFEPFEACYRKHTESFGMFQEFAFELAASVDKAAITSSPVRVEPLTKCQACDGTGSNNKSKCFTGRLGYIDPRDLRNKCEHCAGYGTCGPIDKSKSIKKPDRSLYKFLFKYKDGRDLKDLLRCTFVFENGDDLQNGLNHIITKRHAQINIIKNGWANYTEDKHGEYVDVKIIFILDNGACCEVQMLTKPLYDVKKVLHGGYGMTRIVNSTKGCEFTDAIKKWTESVKSRKEASKIRTMRKKTSGSFADHVEKFNTASTFRHVVFKAKKHKKTRKMKEKFSNMMRLFNGESAPTA